MSIWIKVENGLPPLDLGEEQCSIYVLVTDGTDIGLGYYQYPIEGEYSPYDRCWHELSDQICDNEKITHWAPLPKIPEK